MLISRVIPEENVPSASEDDTQLVARDRKRKRCQICPSKKYNKTNIICSKCAIYMYVKSTAVCLQHVKIVCNYIFFLFLEELLRSPNFSFV